MMGRENMMGRTPWPSLRLMAMVVASAQLALVLAWAFGVASTTMLAIGTFAGAAFIALRSIAPSLVQPVVVPTHLERRGWHAFERELARARRYERPIALIRGPLPSPTEATAHLDVMADINKSMRSVDTAWIDGGALWILATEADRNLAEQLVDRIVGTTWLEREDVRIASFPADALTAGGLISLLQGDERRPIQLPVRATLDASDAMALAAKAADAAQVEAALAEDAAEEQPAVASEGR
jgi:hypothetical protein